MDQISGLPKIILHDILSRLPKKDAVRTSVLSKAWRETWYTFPIFSISDFQIIASSSQPDEDFPRKRDIFIEYVKKRLLRFLDRGLAIKEFKLKMGYFDLDYISQDADLWLKLASENGVEVLELCLSDGYAEYTDEHDPWYTLPPLVLQAKSLNKLVLMGGISVDQAFLNCSIRFSSLRVLSLWSVLLGDERALDHLISHCPLIEQIALKCCFVYNHPQPVIEGTPVLPRVSMLKSLSISGLQKLKAVEVHGVQELHVDAPNLESLGYCPEDKHKPFKLDFVSCRNLRQLNLWCIKYTPLEDKWFLDLFSKFPFLESLKLLNCSVSERINISSAQLKVLELSNCSKVNEINIDAPKLLSCVYSGQGADNPVMSFLKSSSQLEVTVLIHSDYLELYNLKEFVQNFKPQNVLASLSLFIHPNVIELNPDVLHASSVPPSIKHLDLRAVPKDEALFLPIVNRLLSSCCPETVSICLHSFFCSRAFIVYFYETLMGRRQDECYCSSGDTKCWWHGLKNVKVTSSVKTDENVDFETMLVALPTFNAQENISFRLEF